MKESATRLHLGTFNSANLRWHWTMGRMRRRLDAKLEKLRPKLCNSLSGNQREQVNEPKLSFF